MTGACCVRQTRILIIIGMFILCQVDRFTLHQKFTSFSSTKVVTPLHDNVNKQLVNWVIYVKYQNKSLEYLD